MKSNNTTIIIDRSDSLSVPELQQLVLLSENRQNCGRRRLELRRLVAEKALAEFARRNPEIEASRVADALFAWKASEESQDWSPSMKEVA